MLVHLKGISYDEFHKLVTTTNFKEKAYELVHDTAYYAISEMIEDSPAVRHFSFEINECKFNKKTTIVDKPDDIIDAIDIAIGNHEINDFVLGDLKDYVYKAIDSYREENSPNIKRLKFETTVGTFIGAVNITLGKYMIYSVALLDMESLYHKLNELINWVYDYQDDDYVVDTESGVVYKSLN